MTRTLLVTGLRELARRPLHTALMVTGVALGVAVVISIELASDSARRGFELSTEAITGRATHQVRGGPSGVPQDLLRRLRAEAGLRASAPVVEGHAMTVRSDRRSLHLLGLDPLSEDAFGRRLGTDSVAEPGFATLLVSDRAVIVGAPFAADHGLRVGSPLELTVGDRIETLEVAGVLHAARDEDASALETVVLLDIGAAQRLFGLGDRVSRIDLVATPAEIERLRGLLTADLRLVAASEQAATARRLTEAFELNLTALSLLALLVGMFLIYNTVLFDVVRRRAILGTLRLLGATPAQIFGLVLAETAVTAAAGSLLGTALGWLLAQGAVRLLTRTINDLYYVVSVDTAPLTPGAAGAALVLGIGAGLLSALAPALEAARVQPVEALRRSDFERRAGRLLGWAAGVGLASAVAGGLSLTLPGRSLLAAFAGLFAVVVGFALATPALTAAAMRVATPLAGLAAGTLGRLAARTVLRSVSRTGVAVAALAVAVSVTIGVGLMIGSFRSTVLNWLDLLLRADIFVAAPGVARTTSVLSADVPAKVSAVPGVAWVETFRSTVVASPLGEVQLAVADPRRARDPGLYRTTEGDPTRTWAEALAGAVIVSEPFARRHGLPERGATVTLQTDRGERVFPVAGVVYDYASERGTVFMTRNVYERHWNDRGISSLGVHLAPGAPLEETTRRLRDALAGRALQVIPNRELRRQALRVFDRTFALTQALRLLAMVVAFIGVWSALMALQVERTRELATMQALGLRERQQWTLALLETGLMGAVAGLVSLPLGWLLARILVDVVNLRSFGWSLRLEPDPWLFVQALALSVTAAMLASVYPLLRLRRQPLAGALRQE